MSSEISLTDLRRLAAICELPAITVYLPGPGRFRHARQVHSRFRELLEQAERTVRTWWTDAVRARQLLAPAHALLERTTLDELGSSTLACFITSRGMKCLRLPVLLHELVYIGPHLHLTPLLPFVDAPAYDGSDGRTKLTDNFPRCTELDRIFSAVHNDRVELLGFVPDRELWGTYGESVGDTKLHPSRQDDDECLINLLFILAVLRGTPWIVLPDQHDSTPFSVMAWLKPDSNERHTLRPSEVVTAASL